MASVAAAARPDVISRDMVVLRSWELECCGTARSEKSSNNFFATQAEAATTAQMARISGNELPNDVQLAAKMATQDFYFAL
jgi:hypothetical protein